MQRMWCVRVSTYICNASNRKVSYSDYREDVVNKATSRSIHRSFFKDIFFCPFSFCPPCINGVSGHEHLWFLLKLPFGAKIFFLAVLFLCNSAGTEKRQHSPYAELAQAHLPVWFVGETKPQHHLSTHRNPILSSGLPYFVFLHFYFDFSKLLPAQPKENKLTTRAQNVLRKESGITIITAWWYCVLFRVFSHWEYFVPAVTAIVIYSVMQDLHFKHACCKWQLALKLHFIICISHNTLHSVKWCFSCYCMFAHSQSMK